MKNKIEFRQHVDSSALRNNSPAHTKREFKKRFKRRNDEKKNVLGLFFVVFVSKRLLLLQLPSRREFLGKFSRVITSFSLEPLTIAISYLSVDAGPSPPSRALKAEMKRKKP